MYCILLTLKTDWHGFDQSQENVSCLNTSLVILMLARRRGKLPFYLSALQEKELCREIPRLPAQQLPQPAALLAAPLPQQGQGQHLPGERELCSIDHTQISSHNCELLRHKLFYLFPKTELLYSLHLLEGDGLSAAGLWKKLTLCYCLLHWWSLQGPGQRLPGAVTVETERTLFTSELHHA